jgi:hypothetical protein
MASCYLWVIRGYLAPGMPYTHDGMNHLARFAAYKIALREGQLPPRFAGNLLNHYGYPVLNFNYPLANILALPLAFAHVSYEFILKMQMVAGIACGALGFIVWMREWGRSKGAIVFAVLLWISAPFLLNILYVRGNIGELWATALWPWLWVALLRWLRVQRVSRKEMVLWFGVWSAFWLAHNLYSVFGALVVIGGRGGGKHRVNFFKNILELLANHLPCQHGFAVISVIIAGGKNVGAKNYPTPYLLSKTLTPSFFVDVQKIFAFSSKSVFHPVVASQVGRNFSWHDDVINGERLVGILELYVPYFKAQAFQSFNCTIKI